MRFTFTILGTGGPQIEINQSLWTTKVYIDGKETQRLKAKNRPFAIPMSDGSTRQLFVKRDSWLGFDPVPRVTVDEQEVLLARRLVWYEGLLAAIPLILILFGGALGGLIGAIGTALSFRALRIERSLGVRALLAFGIALISAITYLFVATIFFVLFRT